MRRHREDHFTEFRGHTLLKHGVLHRYVLAWIQILKRRHSTLWVVDGFAGKGKDDTGRSGSPLLLAQSAAQLREENADVRLIAIEERHDYYTALKENLATFDAEASSRVPVAFVRQGTLAANADEAFRMVAQSPAFFFLDPFGADGLSLELVRRVLALPFGEVFALFSHRGVGRHLAVLATDPHTDQAHRAVATAPSLFPDLDDERLAAELLRAEEADAALLPTKAAALRILSELFGSAAAVEEVMALPPGPRGREVVNAYVRTLQSTCRATHVTSLGMFDEEQASTYYLIHAAKNDQAKYKMKEAIRGAMSKSDLPEATKLRIRWLHAGPIDEILEAVLTQFAGEQVRWSDTRDPITCVKGYALRETDMSFDQAEELKERLEVYVIERRPLSYRFPPT